MALSLPRLATKGGVACAPTNFRGDTQVMAHRVTPNRMRLSPTAPSCATRLEQATALGACQPPVDAPRFKWRAVEVTNRLCRFEGGHKPRHQPIVDADGRELALHVSCSKPVALKVRASLWRLDEVGAMEERPEQEPLFLPRSLAGPRSTQQGLELTFITSSRAATSDGYFALHPPADWPAVGEYSTAAKKMRATRWRAKFELLHQWKVVDYILSTDFGVTSSKAPTEQEVYRAYDQQLEPPKIDAAQGAEQLCEKMDVVVEPNVEVQADEDVAALLALRTGRRCRNRVSE